MGEVVSSESESHPPNSLTPVRYAERSEVFFSQSLEDLGTIVDGLSISFLPHGK